MIRAFQANRFLILLCTIMVLFLMSPIAKQLGLKTALLLLDAAFTFVFLASVYAVSRNRRRFIIGSILLVPTISLTWIDPFIFNATVQTAMTWVLLLFFAFIIYGITTYVLGIDEVTLEQVAGTLCVYLLIGLLWSLAYSLIEIYFPASFSKTDMAFFDFNYFSFVTLTTLGYGDISPVSTVARAFAIVEAILGQFFLAVLVARQVGLYISSSQHR